MKKQTKSDQTRKVENSQHVRSFQRNKNVKSKRKYVPRYKSNFEPTCFYCGIKGHTPNACYIRTYSVEKGHYVWVKKGEKYEGPKAIWVPNES